MYIKKEQAIQTLQENPDLNIEQFQETLSSAIEMVYWGLSTGVLLGILISLFFSFFVVSYIFGKFENKKLYDEELIEEALYYLNEYNMDLCTNKNLKGEDFQQRVSDITLEIRGIKNKNGEE